MGVGVDRADHPVTDDQRQRQRRVHTHPRHPATEMRPPAVAAQRSTDPGRPDRMQVMHGPSPSFSYCMVSISTTNSVVTDHA